MNPRGITLREPDGPLRGPQVTLGARPRIRLVLAKLAVLMSSLLGACAIAQHQSIEELRSGDELPLDSVFAQYTTLGDGPLDVTNRFLRLAPATVTRLLPDTSFCHAYFAANDETVCFRAQSDEAFQVRRLDARSVHGSADAHDLVRAGLGQSYSRIRDLFFLTESVQAAEFQCASFSVNQLLVSYGTLTFENFHAAPRGLRLAGIACRMDGETVAHVDSAGRASDYGVWDSFTIQNKRYLLLLEEGYEWSALQLYAVDPPRLNLIKEWEIYSG